MELILPNLREGYIELVNAVLNHGSEISPRGLATLEVTGVAIVVEDATAPMLPIGIGRRVNLSLASVESLDLIAGSCHPALLGRASPRYGDVLVDPYGIEYGSYGLRTQCQFYDVLDLLKSDASSRQAVMNIWDKNDLTHIGDKPCTLTLHFLLRDKLELHVTMRSNDVIRGTTYDCFMFHQLQLTVARLLNVEAGTYRHTMNSAHLYISDMPIVEGLEFTSLRENTLPRGVILPTERSDIFYLHRELDTLLEEGPDGVSSDFRALNPWYCEQIGKLFEKNDEQK